MPAEKQRNEMESFYRTHAYLVEHTNAPVRRDLMDEIDWSARLIGIKGTRGVGKTTFLLQYAKEKFGTDRSCLFINMNNFYFSGHSIVDFANEFQKRGGKVLLIDQVFKHPEWSKEAHDRGLKVNVWTVDKAEDMKWLIDQKVDFITTNEPTVAQEILK